MTLDDLLPRLRGVRQTRNGIVALCDAHGDQHPSLSIRDGERGLLVRCWAGCTVAEICTSLGLTVQDLFYDALSDDPQQRQAAARARDQRHQQQAAAAQQHGRRIDALKAADYHIRSRQGMDISQWNDQKLDDELSVLADAYALLESEERDG